MSGPREKFTQSVADPATRIDLDTAGFSGNRDDDHDPRNRSLDEVLDHRSGIPITLSRVSMIAPRSRLRVH